MELWVKIAQSCLFATPWNSPGQNAGVGSLPFSRGSSQPRDRAQVSHIAGEFFTRWATKEAQEYWSGLPCPPPEDLPNPGIKPTFPTLKADSLSSKAPGKPKNTGVGSLSLLQQIFLTQEVNQSLLHCRWSLYQLSYEGSLSSLWVSWKWSYRIFGKINNITNLFQNCFLLSSCTGVRGVLPRSHGGRESTRQ